MLLCIAIVHIVHSLHMTIEFKMASKLLFVFFVFMLESCFVATGLESFLFSKCLLFVLQMFSCV